MNYRNGEVPRRRYRACLQAGSYGGATPWLNPHTTRVRSKRASI